MAESLPSPRRAEGRREGRGLTEAGSGRMKKGEDGSFGGLGEQRGGRGARLGTGGGWGGDIEYGRGLAGREMKFCRLLK